MPAPKTARRLFATLDATPGEELEGARRLPLDLIDPNPFQTRQVFDPEFLEELATSLREGGRLLQPIRVRPQGDRYQIVNGEQRFRAATMAGWTAIPAIIEDLSDEEADLATLEENARRRDPHPEDIARHLARIQERYQISERELARRIGKGRNWVNNHLRTLRKRPDLLARLGLPDDDPERLTWPQVLTLLGEDVTYDKSPATEDSSDVTYDKSPEGVERAELDERARPGTFRWRPWQTFATVVARTRPEDVPAEERATFEAQLAQLEEQIQALRRGLRGE